MWIHTTLLLWIYLLSHLCPFLLAEIWEFSVSGVPLRLGHGTTLKKKESWGFWRNVFPKLMYNYHKLSWGNRYVEEIHKSVWLCLKNVLESPKSVTLTWQRGAALSSNIAHLRALRVCQFKHLQHLQQTSLTRWNNRPISSSSLHLPSSAPFVNCPYQVTGTVMVWLTHIFLIFLCRL